MSIETDQIPQPIDIEVVANEGGVLERLSEVARDTFTVENCIKTIGALSIVSGAIDIRGGDALMKLRGAAQVGVGALWLKR